MDRLSLWLHVSALVFWIALLVGWLAYCCRDRLVEILAFFVAAISGSVWLVLYCLAWLKI